MLKGILLRASLTGFPEVESMLMEVIPVIWRGAASYNQNKHEWRWQTGELLKLAHFGEMSD
jgi:hypothetical protein